MTYDTKHKATFLVSLFLTSKFSLKYVIDSYQHAILTYISSVIDFESNLSKKKQICFSRKQIATYARCSEVTVKRTIQYFKKKRILNVIPVKGWHSIYSIGRLLIAYAQRKLKLTTGRVYKTRESGLPDPTSNTSFNIKDNNKAVVTTVKKQKPKKDQKEYKDSLKTLAKKLGLDSNH